MIECPASRGLVEQVLCRRRSGDRGVVVTDGPYIEAKELLGGFVILETETLDEALAIAAEWPSLAIQPNATVQVQPVFVRGPSDSGISSA